MGEVLFSIGGSTLVPLHLPMYDFYLFVRHVNKSLFSFVFFLYVFLFTNNTIYNTGC